MALSVHLISKASRMHNSYNRTQFREKSGAGELFDQTKPTTETTTQHIKQQTMLHK